MFTVAPERHGGHPKPTPLYSSCAEDSCPLGLSSPGAFDSRYWLQGSRARGLTVLSLWVGPEDAAVG